MPADYDSVMKILGKQGDFKDGVLKINIPRNDLKVTTDGIATPTPFGDANAEVAGDVAMLSSEVTPVLKALRANGLNVVAIHHHMTGTQPTVYFLHYWGTGPAEKLATGFKAALNELGKGHAAHH